MNDKQPNNEHETDTPRFGTLFTHLPVAWGAMMVEEWNSRTRFGKLVYPLWFFDSAMKWMTFLFLMVVMAVANAFISTFSTPSLKTPTIYKGKND